MRKQFSYILSFWHTNIINIHVILSIFLSLLFYSFYALWWAFSHFSLVFLLFCLSLHVTKKLNMLLLQLAFYDSFLLCTSLV